MLISWLMEARTGWGIRTVDGAKQRWFHLGMIRPPDLSRLRDAEKDALIVVLWTQVRPDRDAARGLAASWWRAVIRTIPS
jgi:hypothetical protein